MFAIVGYINYKYNLQQPFQFLFSQQLLSKMSSTFTRKKIENYSYGLADVIGKGYSSQVYTGRQDETNQKVAIKVIDMKMLKNEINRILLQSEIAILKELKNQQNILNVHEIFTTKNNTYIITQLCDTDLNKLIKHKMSQNQACGYMDQIIKGYINFAKKDIIHRDLKPANILATEDRKLKIADFGFAIKVQDAAKSTKYNVGSPLYMAPESLRRNQYTLKTDIWALGVIFFQLLTGQTPWKARNQKQLIRKIESEQIEKLLEPLTFQSNTKLFLRKTLRMDKNQRFGLDDICKFRFKEAIQRILSQKTTNVSLNSKSNTKNEVNINIMSPKKQQNCFENKLIQKTSDPSKKLNKESSAQYLSLFHQQSFNQSLQLKSTSTDKLAIVFDPKKRVTNKSTQKTENPEMNKQDIHTNRDQKCDKKKFSKILIAQIHFCRFLYKLLQRLIESEKSGLLRQPNNEMKTVIADFEGIISYKIQNLLTFKNNNFIGLAGYQEYKQSTDFPKIMKITEEYKDRYSRQFKTGWQTNNYSLSSNNIYALIQLLSMLLEESEKDEDFIKKYSKDIIILDYLITAKQLIEMLKQSDNYQKFADKSRIEEIVEGKTAIIHWGLYRRIMERSKNLMGATSKRLESNFKFIENLIQIY